MKAILLKNILYIHVLVMSITCSAISASDAGLADEIANMAQELSSGQRVFCSDDGRASVVFYLFSYIPEVSVDRKTYHLRIPPSGGGDYLIVTSPQRFLGVTSSDAVLDPIMRSVWGQSRVIVDDCEKRLTVEELPALLEVMIGAYLGNGYDDDELARFYSVFSASTVENKQKK